MFPPDFDNLLCIGRRSQLRVEDTNAPATLSRKKSFYYLKKSSLREVGL